MPKAIKQTLSVSRVRGAHQKCEKDIVNGECHTARLLNQYACV